VITPRGVRVVQALAATVVAALILLVAGAPGNSQGDDAWLELEGEEALVAAPCPAPSSVELATASAGRLEAARDGSFEIFGPRRVELRVPIDWTTDPLGAHRFRQNLHKLRFLEPLLASYATSGNVEDLRQAAEIGLDWVRANPRDERATPVEAWSDKVVGDRVPFLSYLVRAAACEGLLHERERRVLLTSVAEHGNVLASKRIYAPDNHGLFVDLGLARLTNFFPFLERTDEWRELARERFERTLRGRLAAGVWLEHSSAYQFLAIRALEDFLRVHGPDAELESILAEMHAAAAWFVKPNGEITQFGDSNLEPVPDWAAAEAARLGGLVTFRDAGFAFVRARGEAGDTGYLAVTDGFHNLTHKHADELSFELFDHGTSIVIDTGLYDKDPGPVRDYVVSNRAHSTLTVDGLDLPISDAGEAYGSGLVATGAGDGWYAIEGANPLLAGQGVRHERLFLYRPGVALLIVDRVRADAPHTYTHYLHLHPNVDARPGPEGALDLEAANLDAAIYDLDNGTPVTRSKVRGQKEPLQGFTSPDFREWLPRWAIAYSDQAQSEIRALSVALDPSRLRAAAISTDGARTDVELVDGEGARSRLDVVRTGETLEVSAGG
jgi:hypothetical protein